jgi:hypothetical protein
MKTFLLFVMLLLLQTANAQTKVFKLDLNTASIKEVYTNQLAYKDKDGDHVVLDQEELDGAKNDDMHFGNFYVSIFDFVDKKSKTHAFWKLPYCTYPIPRCKSGGREGFVVATFAATDLDKDGYDEVWLLYRLTCPDNKNTDDILLIMHTKGKKYIIRGGSQAKFDEAFKTAPTAFKQYALGLWKENLAVSVP